MAAQKAPETAAQGKKSPANGQPEAEIPDSPPRKKRRLLLSLVVVVVAVGGTAAFFYPKLVHAPHGVHNGPILQLASSTLNLNRPGNCGDSFVWKEKRNVHAKEEAHAAGERTEGGYPAEVPR